jgi:hypothetical protein
MGGDEFVYRGTLAETPLPEMLATIHRYRVPGVMEVSTGDVTKKVYIADGDVIFASSSDRLESLGDFLVRSGRISKAQYRVSCDELARSPGKRHGTVLVELGFLEPEELGPAVREQVQEVLWSLFDCEEGAVSFKVGRFREDEVIKIKIPTPRAIVSGCRRIADGKRVTARLGGRSTVLRRLPFPEHLSGLRLEPGERQLLEMVDGKRTLVELCQEGPYSAGINARLLYAFLALQLVERRGEGGGIRIQVRRSED